MNNQYSTQHQQNIILFTSTTNQPQQTTFITTNHHKIIPRTQAEDLKLEHNGIEPFQFQGIFMNRNRLVVDRLPNPNNQVTDPIFQQDLLNNEKTGSKSQIGKKINYIRRPLSQIKDQDDKSSIPKKKTLLNQSL